MVLILAGSGMVGTARATLIVQDLSTPGDGYLTYDSDAGLSWLDVPLTLNHSYDEVISGYGGYTTTLGFRYATGAEVGRLFSDAGVAQGHWVWGYWNFSNPNYLANVTLASLIGITYPSDGLSTYTYGLTGSTTLSTPGSHDVAVVGYNNHADYIANQAAGSMNDAGKWFYAGSFLVLDTAPVPEPSTMLLLGGGLAGLVGWRLRRRGR